MAENLNQIPIIVLLVGILGGTILLFIGDKIFAKKMKLSKDKKRTSMLFFFILLHNIPEGCVCYVSQKKRYNIGKKVLEFVF